MTIFDKMIAAENSPIGKIITEPTLLSECGTKITIDEKDKYHIEIEAGDFLVVSMGFTAGKPGAKFIHPNIAASRKVIHEFKHYRNNGSKFWSSRAGVDHILVIPRNQIKLLPEKGYSYIKAEINGVKVSFNVSGGTANGWTDFLNTSTATSVNHKLLDIKKICEVAVRNSPLEPITVKALDQNEEENWNRLAAKATPKIKERIAKMVKDGEKPVVHFLTGYSYHGEKSGVAIEVNRRYKKVSIAERPGCFSLDPIGAPKAFILEVAGAYWKVNAKVTQIDWHKTAEANQIIA
jgi:hypothetical protein